MIEVKMISTAHNKKEDIVEIDELELTEEEKKEFKIRQRIEEIDFQIMVLDMHRSYDRNIANRVINKLMNEKKELLVELK